MSFVKGAVVVARHAGVANTDMNREPVHIVLSETSAYADIAVFWQQRNVSGTWHVEAPARLVQRNYRINKADLAFTALTGQTVVRQQSAWVSGLGHCQSPLPILIPRGANAGRLLMLFTQLDSEEPTFTGQPRNIYRMVNDAAGDPLAWGEAVKILDVSSVFGSRATVTPSGSYVVTPADHAYPDRIVTTFVIDNAIHWLYSDDWGVTWSISASYTGAENTFNESNIALRPDGSLIATHRLSTEPTNNRRSWSTSADGVAWVEQGLIPSWAGAACSAGLTQVGPKTYMSRPEAAPVTRSGIFVGYADDGTLEIKNSRRIVASCRYFGYSCLTPLFSDKLLISAEGGKVPFNVDNTVYLMVIDQW